MIYIVIYLHFIYIYTHVCTLLLYDNAPSFLYYRVQCKEKKILISVAHAIHVR